MFQEGALYRRQQTGMLEACCEKLISLRCTVKVDEEQCRETITNHTDEAKLASDAFKKGWRSEAGDESRNAICPAHSKERGLHR